MILDGISVEFLRLLYSYRLLIFTRYELCFVQQPRHFHIL